MITIGLKIIPRASYMRLNNMYLVVHIACFKVKSIQNHNILDSLWIKRFDFTQSVMNI